MLCKRFGFLDDSVLRVTSHISIYDVTFMFKIDWTTSLDVVKLPHAQ